MTRRNDLDQAAITAIRRLRALRDAHEQVGRPDGDYLTISRQTLDACLDDIDVTARCVRDLAAGVS
jgi:hypothetical protein